MVIKVLLEKEMEARICFWNSFLNQRKVELESWIKTLQTVKISSFISAHLFWEEV